MKAFSHGAVLRTLADGWTRKSDVLIFIPTYNEKDNVTEMHSRIRSHIRSKNLDCDILFLDDSSPDGTGRVLDSLCSVDSQLCIMHRTSKLGIGGAHLEAIYWAYSKGYRIFLSLDCDFTHSPEQISELFKLAEQCDVAVGSRHLKEGSLKDWNLFRKFLTKLGYWMTTKILGMPYDATGAFRVYRLDRIPPSLFDLIRARGYAFFFESLFIIHKNGFSILELPVSLPKRTYGSSKMTFREIRKSLKMLFEIYFRKTLSPETLVLRHKFREGSSGPLFDPQDWDSYWSSKTKTTPKLYGFIAALYRKLIIRPLLNHFGTKYFKPGFEVCHAGCGSGQVDTDLAKRISITALDISTRALELYRVHNGKKSKTLHGDIFHVPTPSESFDAIYNLGVMEHFSSSDIEKILREFSRILKPDGTMILFWPPEYGLSVVFLKLVHFVLNNILKKNVVLHPAEISRIQSRREVRELMTRNGFDVIETYFGPRDAFTYVVVVARKTPVSERSKPVVSVLASPRTATQDWVSHVY